MCGGVTAQARPVVTARQEPSVGDDDGPDRDLTGGFGATRELEGVRHPRGVSGHFDCGGCGVGRPRHAQCCVSVIAGTSSMRR